MSEVACYQQKEDLIRSPSRKKAIHSQDLLTEECLQCGWPTTVADNLVLFEHQLE